MNMINVVWHKIPDTDSVVAALVFADYLNKLWIEAKAFRLWEINNETKFILEKFWVKAPDLVNAFESWSKIALVDHNEKSQATDNIDELDLVYIVDHHKIWALSTTSPIFARFEWLWSTNSILYKMFIEASFEISKINASLIISAIISDTLFFRSPTTTSEDKKIVEELNKIAQIENLENFSLEMFNAKSDLWDISATDLIKLDYKEFEVEWKKFWAWTVETTNPDYSLSRKDEIIETMKKIKNESWLTMMILSIVDILNEKNVTFAPEDFEIKVLKDVFWAETIDNLADLWSRISRKKQIIPQLTQYFSKTP